MVASEGAPEEKLWKQGASSPCHSAGVSVPDRYAARVTGWDQGAPSCWARTLGQSGCGWQQAAPEGGQVWAHVPCTPGARSSLKRREGVITCKLLKVKDHEEWGRGVGVVLCPARAACQEGRRDEKRMEMASRVQEMAKVSTGPVKPPGLPGRQGRVALG